MATPAKAAAPVEQDNFLAGLPLDNLATAAPLSGPSPYAAKAKRKASSDPSDWQAYLKKLAIVVGIVCGVIALTLPLLAFPNSPVCIIPIALLSLGMIGFAMAGRIWFIVLGFKQSVAQGLLVMLVPYYWLFFLAKNKQVCIKPLLTMGATLIRLVCSSSFPCF